MNDQYETDQHATTDQSRGAPRRRGRGRNRRMHDHHSDHHFAEHERGGGRGAGRHRARRGAVRIAILTLLNERPMHGYEIITELEARTDGRWRPSPGAVYPALDKMEERGAVISSEADGKRRYELTDRGRELLAEIQTDDATEPWNQHSTSGRGEMRRLISELGGQIRQIARFGTTEQREAATGVLEDTKRKLYDILATPSDAAASSPDEPGDSD